jgi:hypothetical protein
VAYSSNVGVGQVGFFWVGADEDVASNIISPTGFSQQALGSPSFGGFLDASNAGFTQRAFGTPSVILGSLNPTGFTQRAFGTPVFSIQAIGFTRQAFGDPSVAGHGFVLAALGINQQAFGTPAIVNPASPINVFIHGADKTAWVTSGTLKRSWQVGSICTASFQLDSSNAGSYRPNEIDSVVIMLGTYRFFSGWVDNTQEMYYPGSGQFQIVVNCVSYAAGLEKIFIGMDINVDSGSLGQLISYIRIYLLQWGITITVDPSADGYNPGPQVFNYPPVSQMLQSICQQTGLMYLVDQWQTLRLFLPDFGYAVAPFQITDSNKTEWQQLTIQKGGMYRNVQGARGTQQTTLADTSPAVPGYTSGSSNRLSYIAFAEDPAEIAAVGRRFTVVQDIKTAPNVGVLQTTADILLGEGSKHIIKAKIECTRNGLEPGQLLTINTSIPPFSEDLLIEQVDSTAEGGLVGGEVFFRHVVSASNSTFRRGAGIQWMNNLWNAAYNPPLDRTTYTVNFTLAETIEGIANPGLTTGVKPAQVKAPKLGIARDVTVIFTTPPATTACTFDVTQNGVSIFAPGHVPTVDPTNAEMTAGSYTFAATPVTISEGDVFQLEVVTADSTAMDGILSLTVYG